MIQANELRIGNYVSDIHASDKFHAKVVELKKNRCYYGLFHCHYDDLKPITLTPEILEKCGFKYKDLNGDSGFWQIKHPTAAGLIEILDGEDGFWYNYQSEIKYLHQLQNLYFTMTGEELKVQL